MTTHKNLVGFGSRSLTQAMSCLLVLLLALMTVDLRAANVAHAADGDLDLTFGEGGTVTTDFSRSLDSVSDIKVQPDGKIVAVGGTNLGFQSGDFALARYNNINISSFDICIQDDSNGNMLQIDSLTGEYKFTACSASLILAGTGSVKVKGCKMTLKHTTADRNISVAIKSCKDKASASIEALSSGRSFALSDSNTAQGACVCQ